MNLVNLFSAGELERAFEPILEIISEILPYLLTLIGAVGSVWCVVLGVKLAKAEEQQDRDKAKSSLKNAIIGFVLIFVLIATLQLAMPALTSWMKEVVK